MPPTPPHAFDVTVSIATYDRPEGLARTLESVLGQTNRLGLAYEILVTDNHPAGAGEAVVARLAANAAVPLRYQRDLTRNMSTLRNVGIKAARGAYVAFIDDDEFADPDWLDALMGAVRRTAADIAVGPRLAVFASGKAPAYDPTGAMFARDLDLPGDAVLDLLRADGKQRYGLGTGNSIFRAETCFRDPEPFSRAYGDAGGEDAEFFIRQHRQGRRIVWAADARVTEIVFEHRTEVAYRLVRARRETQHYVAIYLANAPHPRRTWLKLMAKGALQTAAGFAIALLTGEFGSRERLRGRLLMAYGLGKLSWQNPVGYIDEAAFAPQAS